MCHGNHRTIALQWMDGPAAPACDAFLSLHAIDVAAVESASSRELISTLALSLTILFIIGSSPTSTPPSYAKSDRDCGKWPEHRHQELYTPDFFHD